MINLFFVTHDFSGVKTYTNELLGYLSEQPDIVVHRIFIESRDYKEYTETKEANILNIYIPLWEQQKRISFEKYASRCMDLLDHVVRNKKHIIFHLNNAIHVNLGIEARKRFGAKMIYTLHFLPNYFTYLNIDGSRMENLHPFDNLLENKVIHEVDQIICVTQFAQEMAIHFFNCPIEKTIAIHNGYGEKSKVISISEKQRKTIRNDFGFNEADQIILFVGRLEKRKGLKHLIDAFLQICQRYSELRLVIAGDGNFEEMLRFIKGKWGQITFTGKISSQELLKLYTIAKIGVIPSIYEQCSYVALEMMHYGMPIVVSGSPGLNELFLDNENALIVPVYEHRGGLLESEIHEKELVEKLEIILNDNELRQKLGKNARMRWEQNYTVKNMGKATVKQYKKLITENQINYSLEGRRAESWTLTDLILSAPTPSPKKERS